MTSKVIPSLCLFGLLLVFSPVISQEIPAKGENIAWLQTFGNQANPKFGDDDYTQIFFFYIPETQKTPIYLRIFDPECGGQNDLGNGSFNTTTKYSVYGGKGAHSNPDAQALDPVGNFKSGVLLATQTFSSDPKFDNSWFTFGPLNPAEGEYSEQLKGRLFKLICQGTSGDDGNLYRYYLSTSPNENRPVEGGNGFTYEYSFRLMDKPGSVTHLYPFADENAVAIKQHNFDFDGDGYIKLYSVSKNGHTMAVSGDNNAVASVHKLTEEEKGKSLNIQIIRKGSFSNDMVFSVTNEYDKPIPFFAVPIGGPPKYKYTISVKYE